MSTYSPPLNHVVAAWMAKVAKALEDVGACESGHGEYYVSRVSVGYDGEDTGYAVEPDEFGGFGLIAPELKASEVTS